MNPCHTTKDNEFKQTLESAMTTECKYLYGIMPIAKARSLGAIGMDGGEVRVVTHGAIAMVASPAERVDFSQLAPDKTLRYLAEHQRVLEEVMTGSSVIPLKFGMFADDDRQILSILRSGQGIFARALEKYAGKFELDLVASWADLKAVLSEIGAEQAVVSMRAEVSAHGEPTMEQRLRLGQLVNKLLTQRGEGIAAELIDALRAKFPDIIVNQTKDDSMILNVAVLLGRYEEARFDEFIDQLNGDYRNGLDFRCVGPLPPYSFATAEVLAVDAEELDAARQLLGLGESPGPAEIKASYRQALQEVHPDRNPDADAAERMKELVAAHELLAEYASSCQETPSPDEDRPVIVKIRSLPERALRTGRSPRAPAPSGRLESVVAGADSCRAS